MSKKEEKTSVQCCVKNCQKEVPVDKAIVIRDQYFCGICGVAYVRSNLKL